jgi:hypothetical protein
MHVFALSHLQPTMHHCEKTSILLAGQADAFYISYIDSRLKMNTYY